MYHLNDYARMIADAGRTGAYAKALEECVRPGHVVCDIGSGTGFFAVLACRFGARRVYAIEMNEVIESGPELAQANGCADRIVFLREDALTIELPERADVVVADVRGALPVAKGALAILARARERFLAKGGAFIPQRDDLFVAIVCGDVHTRALGPARAFDVDLSAMHDRLANTVYRDTKRTTSAADLLTEGVCFASIDYAKAGAEPIKGRASWTMKRADVGYGLLVWFDATLTATARYSTAPGIQTVYSQTFLPWSRPIKLEIGDSVEVDLRVQPEGAPWSWSTAVTPVSGAPVRLRQSSLLGAISPPQPRERR